MLQRLSNAILTRLVPGLRTEITRIIAEERDHDKKLVRELVGEMEDVLEKFSRVVARQAMRRSRAMKAALDEDEQPTPEAVPGPAAALTGKAAIRARLRAGGMLARLHANPPPDEVQ